MPAELTSEIAARRDFSLAHDPFLRVAQRLHLARADGDCRARLIVALAWVPLCLGALERVAGGHPPAPILFDISVHTRLLLGIPLLLAAERMLDRRCRGAIGQLYEGAFCERATLDRIVGHAIRLRGSRLVEIAILGFALLVGQATLWGFVGSTGFVAGVDEAGELSFARIWYASLALPIVQFFLVRWLWHWLIWSYVVIRVSRLELATIATHPDRAAGIGFLGGPISAFWMFVLAVSTMMASAWGTQMLAGRASVESFVPTFVVFVLAAAALACGPLLLYMGILYRAEHRATRVYNGFALDYVRAFHHKWIEAPSGTEKSLGSADIQSLSDLGGSYERLVHCRLVPFGVSALAGIWLGAMIPMVPLAVAAMPMDELFRHIGSKMVGGLL